MGRSVHLQGQKEHGPSGFIVGRALICAVDYGYLERGEYDPSEGITLHVLGQKIRLKGRNLNAEARPAIHLFEGITHHKVTWVRAADHRESMKAEDGDTVIDAIEV